MIRRQSRLGFQLYWRWRLLGWIVCGGLAALINPWLIPLGIAVFELIVLALSLRAGARIQSHSPPASMIEEDDEGWPTFSRTPNPEDSDLVMIIEGPPPREGESPPVNMDSPEAIALRHAAAELIARSPEHFPLRGEYTVGLWVRSGARFTFGDPDALVISAIEDVLIDAGLIEAGALDWDRFQIDPDLTDGYSVEIDFHP